MFLSYKVFKNEIHGVNNRPNFSLIGGKIRPPNRQPVAHVPVREFGFLSCPAAKGVGDDLHVAAAIL